MQRRPRSLHAGGSAAVRAVRSAQAHRIGGISAELAFFSLLSIPPAILILAGLAGYADSIFGPGVQRNMHDGIVNGLGTFIAPDTMRDFVRPVVDDLFTRGRADILSVGAVVALWSASRATKVFMETMNVVYAVPDRDARWRRRIGAVGLTMAGLAVTAVAIPFILAGPRIGEAIAHEAGLPSWFAGMWHVLYWPVAVAVGVALLTTIYHFAPSARTRWRRHVPGAIFAAAVWVIAAFGLRAYAAASFGKGSAFGPLSAPIILLLWLYLSAVAVLLGGELNAQLGLVDEEQTGRDPGSGER